MANMRMVVGSLADSAILLASDSVGDLVVENLQRSEKERVWRSNETSLVTIAGTFVSPQAVNCFVLAGHNLSGAGSVELILRLDNVVVYSSGVYLPANHIPAGVWRAGVDPFGATYDDNLPNQIARLWMSELVIADSFEIKLRDAGNPAGYVQASRLLMGQFLSPEWNMDWGAGVEWLDSSQHVRMEGGALQTISGIVTRQVTLNLSHLTESDRVRFEMDLAARGKAQDVFISLYPEQGGMQEVTHMMIGRRQNNIHLPHSYSLGWGTQLTFIES